MFDFLFSKNEKGGVNVIFNVAEDIDGEKLKDETINDIVENSRVEAERSYKRHLKKKFKDELLKKYNIEVTNVDWSDAQIVSSILNDMIDQLGLIKDK